VTERPAGETPAAPWSVAFGPVKTDTLPSRTVEATARHRFNYVNPVLNTQTSSFFRHSNFVLFSGC